MKKFSLAAAGMLIALTAIPAIADGTADQLRSRRTDLLRRDGLAPSTPVASSDLLAPRGEGKLSLGRVLPGLDPAPSVPVVVDDFRQDFADAPLQQAEGIIVPDVQMLDMPLSMAVPAEQMARIRQELSTLYALDLPVEAQ